MQYPSDWVLDKNISSTETPYGMSVNVVNFYAPAPDVAVAVYREDLNTSQILDVYASISVAADRINFPGFFQLSLDKNAQILGQPAYDLVFEHTLADSAGRTHIFLAREVGTILGHEGYTVIYDAENTKYYNYFPTVQNMIDSLQVNVLRLNETQAPINANVPEI